MQTSLSITLIAGVIAVFAVVPPAHAAGSIEQLDIIAEGVDRTAVVVRNDGDYSGFETTGHKYGIRVFARAGRGSAIATVRLSSAAVEDADVAQPRGYFLEAATGSGWGVYKKSLAPVVSFADTRWTIDPRQLCRDNLEAGMRAGLRKADLLAREWKLTTQAVFRFHAVAVDRAQAPGEIAETGSAPLLYPVTVTCRASR